MASPKEPDQPISNLCKFCQNIAKNLNETSKNNRGQQLPHHPSIKELEASAASGCGLCTQLEQDIHVGFIGDDETYEYDTPALDQIYLEWDYQNNRWVLEKSFPYADEPMRLARYGEQPFHCYRAILGILLAEASSLRHHNARKISSTATALSQCKTWLQECSNSHTLCTQRQEPFTPTRLISISNNHINLCLTSSLSSIPRYASLSHCWGKHQLLTLLKSNLEEFGTCIPSSKLSKTFREAIKITQYLGLEYIWIDSLCIIQDDAEDWKREAVGMSGVYWGSSVNIAATGAGDGSLGCFFGRLGAEPRFDFEGGGGEEETIFSSFPLRFEKSLTQAPLSTRGWCFQERFLPRRTFHLTSREVFWECDERLSSETFPVSIPSWAEKLLILKKQPLNLNTWAEVVNEYSSRQLTFAKDKLVAVSGLAAIFSAEMKDEYVSGLWRRELEEQVCWNVKFPAERYFPRTAPSWSWVSIDGRINSRNDQELEDFCTFVRVENINEEGRMRIHARYIVHATFYHNGAERSGYDRLHVGSGRIDAWTNWDTASTAAKAKVGPMSVILIPIKCVTGGSPKNFLLKTLVLEKASEEGEEVAGLGGKNKSVGGREIGKGVYKRIGYLQYRASEDRAELDYAMHLGYLGNAESKLKAEECVEIRVDERGEREFVVDLI